MSSRFATSIASVSFMAGVLALAAPAEAGGGYNGGWHNGHHGWHSGHHARHFRFAFYPQPFVEPYVAVANEPVVWTQRRHHPRHHRKVCIRFPCY
jgi:hypothetical protein